MMDFTQEEKLFMALYSPGTRPGLIAALEEMKRQLVPDETELAALTDGVLSKLAEVSDEAFSRLDLYDFRGNGGARCPQRRNTTHKWRRKPPGASPAAIRRGRAS